MVENKEHDGYSGYFKCPRSVSFFTEYVLQILEIWSSQTCDWIPSWISKGHLPRSHPFAVLQKQRGRVVSDRTMGSKKV